MGCYIFSFGMKGNNSTKAYNFLDLAQLSLNFLVKISDFSFGLQVTITPTASPSVSLILPSALCVLDLNWSSPPV